MPGERNPKSYEELQQGLFVATSDRAARPLEFHTNDPEIGIAVVRLHDELVREYTDGPDRFYIQGDVKRSNARPWQMTGFFDIAASVGHMNLTEPE